MIYDPELSAMITASGQEILAELIEKLGGLEAVVEDAQRFRWLAENARSHLICANVELGDMRREWRLPTLMHINAVGGHTSVAEWIDIKRGVVKDD